MTSNMRFKISLEKDINLTLHDTNGVTVDEIERLLKYYVLLAPKDRERLYYMMAGSVVFSEIHHTNNRVKQIKPPE